MSEPKHEPAAAPTPRWVRWAVRGVDLCLGLALALTLIEVLRG